MFSDLTNNNKNKSTLLFFTDSEVFQTLHKIITLLGGLILIGSLDLVPKLQIYENKAQLKNPPPPPQIPQVSFNCCNNIEAICIKIIMDNIFFICIV